MGVPEAYLGIKLGVFGLQVATPRVPFGSSAQWNGAYEPLFAVTVLSFNSRSEIGPL